MAKILTLEDAIRTNLHSGDSVAFEGFTHLIPHAAAHEVLRQGITDLTVIRMTPDMIYDQLIGMGRVRKMIFSYAGNPGVGLLRRYRDAIENAWPKRIEIEEHSHSAMAQAYEAGAAGLPCAIFRGYHGAGLKSVTSTIKSVTCPFSGEVLAAVPALNPDVAIIHAQKASKRGDVLIEGILGVQKEVVLAAKRSIVTVEEIVETLDDTHPNACILPHWTISSVAHVRGGAHPSYVQGYYTRDNQAYQEWDKIASDRDHFSEWMTTNVLNAAPSDFADRIAALETKASSEGAQ